MTLDRIYAAIERGDIGRARTECASMLAADASIAAVHHAMGLSLCAEGVLPQALPHFERAADLDSETVRWVRDAGVVCAALHRWMECVDRLTPVVPYLDEQALTAYLLAGVETYRAVFVLERVEGRQEWRTPTDLDARCAYGSALSAGGRHAEAEPLLLECLAHAPRTLHVHDALSDLFDSTGRAEQALHHRQERVRLDPTCARARLRLAISLAHRGWYDAARVERIAAGRLGLTRPQEHSSQMFMMLSDEHETATTLLATSRQGFRDSQPSASAPLPRRSTATSRRLRIGYVSAETRGTPSYYFFRPFLEHHDRSAVEVTLFNCSPVRDLFTYEFQQWPEHWREVAHLPPSQLAAQVRREEFDVLVDLSGHFPFNGLQVLAERVAPVQVAYPNYPGTTGSPCVDYVLTDAWTSPHGTEHEYSERLHRIPTGYLGFDVSSSGVDVGPLPCLANRRPTFGVFQRLSKFTSSVWDALAGVMAAVPDASLALYAADEELARPESKTERAVRRELEVRGVDLERVTCHPPRGRTEQLLAVTGVDVALDTFPYNGQTTTCESLWMGVPVVTLYGHSHVGRVSGALIARAGHPEWIAHSVPQYCAIAASLVSDIDRLARIRRHLRGDFIGCGLPDGRRLARELETAYAALN
jgi:predicted O-linked N-acetylglucosamine transferase (SPINDLY family)